MLKLKGGSGDELLFLKLRDLYPECSFLIEDLDQMFPLRCIADDGCPRNQNCMEKLARRLQYVFDTFKDVKTILLYFRWRDRPGSHRAGVFWRDMREPRYITFNVFAWEKLKKIGQAYEWTIPDELFLQTKVSDSLIQIR